MSPAGQLIFNGTRQGPRTWPADPNPFNALTGTPLARLHRRDAWIKYAQALADGVSLRKAATRCRIALDTAFRWRHRFLKSAKDRKAMSVRGIVEANETHFLKSQKGARKVKGRAPRKRGGKSVQAGALRRRYSCAHRARPDRCNDRHDARGLTCFVAPQIRVSTDGAPHGQ